jgi:nanoRNase/pAp phosphatase (c-di-AMP/oligoRNAs hydrolase)
MAISASEKLRRFYEQFACTDQVLVVINADPDALASAMAVKRLLWRKVNSVSIAHVNIIKRPDNLTMIRLLGIPLSGVEEVPTDRDFKVVMVDSQPSHHEGFARFEPTVVIDHHPEGETEAAFSDIRPKYGATASIMTEYLRAAKIKPAIKLATGLLYAIKSDTNNFERQTAIEDVRAFQFLYHHANMHLIRKIEQAEMSPAFLKYFRKALDERRVIKGRVFVHLGQVINPDVCVLIADFFMRVVSYDWSIVSGISKGRLVIVFRNDGIRKNAGRVAKEAFGGLGSAGGHKNMARAEIALADLKDVVEYRDEKKLLRWIINQVKKRPGKKNGI